MMKRFFALLLSVVMCLVVLASCKKDGDGDPEETTTAPPEEEIPTVEQVLTPFDTFKLVDNPAGIMSGEYITLTEDYRDIDEHCRFSSRSKVRISALSSMFSLDGIIHPTENEGLYARFDKTTRDFFIQKNPNAEMVLRERNTSGVTLRFRTNAEEITLLATMKDVQTFFSHMTDIGCYGFDVYVGTGTNRVYAGGRMQMMVDTENVEQKIKLEPGYKEVMIDFPLYAGVEDVQIVFPTGSKLAKPLERMGGNICFYGSSITQGGVASRPGLAYTNFVCRMFDANCINLGFSSSALGEQEVARFIASRKEITAFVMDYDHNNTVEGLRETHYDFYKTVREGLPQIPILLLVHPYWQSTPPEEVQQRTAIIKATYERAVAEGDKNIYLVTSDTYFPTELKDIYFTDMAHPNDLGFYYMTKAVYNALYPVLNKEN